YIQADPSAGFAGNGTPTFPFRTATQALKAAGDGDDVVLGDAAETRFNFLRQQTAYGDSRPNRCLADYVAPAGDHLGAFAVTAGIGADELAARFAAEHDDYQAIMVKALADRLAEAFAEYLHEIARRAWYETGTKLEHEQLIAERFRGIRPAFGYPACPDHSEKRQLFDLLGAEDAGLALTETYAMTPGASVSGIYLAHPEARYFSVGRIGRDQVEDYARRTGVSPAEAERWLRPNLAYEPGADPAPARV
ncbi:MAG: vitamin B12 dependent-methionine synthase activation domain-containing protein, partial [Gaiellaceae bacterium]